MMTDGFIFGFYLAFALNWGWIRKIKAYGWHCIANGVFQILWNLHFFFFYYSRGHFLN
jgi:hypothetical protein